MGRYLPQLDGLRAIAVLLVIGTHTGYIPGGYVGVDIFFALSGYLITTILLHDRAEKRWSLRRFYSRRARRLCPPLVLLVLVTLPIGGALASSEAHYAAAAVVAVLYLSDFAIAINVHWLGGLAHTWSLALEEQFYLAWPAFLLFSWKRVSRRVIIATTLALALVMLLTLSLAGSAASAAMYLPTGRGGVLLLGCVLALVLDQYSLPRPSVVAVASALGLVLVVFFGADKAEGGGAAAITGLLSSALIAGLIRGGAVARLLSLRPLVWLGQRSYGIYLWHLPIADVMAHGGIQPSHGSLRVLLPTLLGGVVCAALSYRFVESWFRSPPQDAVIEGVPAFPVPLAVSEAQ